MSKIQSLRVQNLRTHQDYTLLLQPKTTIITGPNGSGKTSLIEALYIALQGKSFKSPDIDIIKHGADWYRIDVNMDDGSSRVVKFEPNLINKRKQYIINQKNHYRLTFPYKHPVVLFEPEDLRLINGSPTRRRKFINHLISQIDPQYSVALRRYERALKQRNALLKRSYINNDELFAWNVTMSEHGAYIISKRAYFINELNVNLNEIYHSIALVNDEITINYSINTAQYNQQKLLSDLHSSTKRDKLLGFTSVGPHRHDIIFNFNNKPATTSASRGEVRSMILALKYQEIKIIEDLIKKSPVILLDDVLGELDENRQRNLLSILKNKQLIITDSSKNLKKSSAIRLN